MDVVTVGDVHVVAMWYVHVVAVRHMQVRNMNVVTVRHVDVMPVWNVYVPSATTATPLGGSSRLRSSLSKGHVVRGVLELRLVRYSRKSGHSDQGHKSDKYHKFHCSHI